MTRYRAGHLAQLEDRHLLANSFDLGLSANLGDVTRIDLGAMLPIESNNPHFEIVDGANNPFLSGAAFGVDGVAAESGGNYLTEGTSFNETGILFFVPNVQEPSRSESELGTPADDGVAETFYRIKEGAVGPVEWSGPLTVNIIGGYSSWGENSVPAPNDVGSALNTYRVEQRLNYFSYNDQTGNFSNLVGVDGTLEATTEHAISVFNTAVRNANNVTHPDDRVIDTFINAVNAPRWVSISDDPNNWTTGNGSPDRVLNAQGTFENALTHWARDLVLETRDTLALQNPGAGGVIKYSEASERGGGSGIHATHEAGMDIDHGITGIGPGNQVITTVAQQHGALTALGTDRVDSIFFDVGGFQNPSGASTLPTPTDGIPVLAIGGHSDHFHVNARPPAPEFPALTTKETSQLFGDAVNSVTGITVITHGVESSNPTSGGDSLLPLAQAIREAADGTPGDGQQAWLLDYDIDLAGFGLWPPPSQFT